MDKASNLAQAMAGVDGELKTGIDMDDRIKNDVKKIICDSILTNLTPEELTDAFPLAGNNLDSMAVMRLILGIEEFFEVVFDEDELAAESFENIETVTQLVAAKVDGTYA